MRPLVLYITADIASFIAGLVELKYRRPPPKLG